MIDVFYATFRDVAEELKKGNFDILDRLTIDGNPAVRDGGIMVANRPFWRFWQGGKEDIDGNIPVMISLNCTEGELLQFLDEYERTPPLLKTWRVPVSFITEYCAAASVYRPN